ncbi:MAG: TIR domain-containing protein [Agrobacterium tumefaciens]|nr:TIR domain-containing protein [Agrobacterium tumefaciens]
MQSDEQNVFLSYTSGDRDRVEPIADRLAASGIDAWIDVKRLKAGQNWDFEIRRALERAVVIVVFISNKSVTKRGYVQREIRLGLEKAEEKLADDIYLIPVLLDDDVIVPNQIKDLQFLRASDESFEQNLIDAIKHQFERIGSTIEGLQGEAEIRWQYYSLKEFRDGLPGMEIDLRLIRFISERYPLLHQAGEVIKGDMLQSLMGMRYQTLLPDPECFNFGQDRFRRIHTLDAQPQTPKIRGRVLSIVYSLYSYHAGAAHPNLGFSSYCFLIDPLCQIDQLSEIFEDAAAAFLVLQSEVRSQLLAPDAEEEIDFPSDEDWIKRGTDDWSAMRAFGFDDTGLQIHFAPYEVASYAAGPQVVHVAYEKFAHLVSQVFKSALDIEYL